MGIKLKEGHSLERMALDAEWLSSLGTDLYASVVKLDSAGRARAERSVMKMEQAERIARSLSMLPRIRNGREHAKRWVKERVERFRVEDENVPVDRRQRLDREPALDGLFELEIAARLARWSDLDVSLEEPDIIVNQASGTRLQIACKRPLRTSGVPGAIRDTKSQISRRQDLGLIVVGTEAIFHRKFDPESPVRMAVCDKREDAQREAERLLVQAIAAGEDEIDATYKKGARIPAVLFFGSLLCVLRGVGFASYLVSKRVINKALPGSDKMGRDLQRRLLS